MIYKEWFNLINRIISLYFSRDYPTGRVNRKSTIICFFSSTIKKNTFFPFKISKYEKGILFLFCKKKSLKDFFLYNYSLWFKKSTFNKDKPSVGALELTKKERETYKQKNKQLVSNIRKNNSQKYSQLKQPVFIQFFKNQKAYIHEGIRKKSFF